MRAISPEKLRLFETIPGNNILVNVNPPHFTILGATESYLQVVGKKREQLIGKALFDIFPRNPNDPADTGADDLLFSFDEVMRTKQRHELHTQRYDVASADGSFEERYWNTSNTPYLDEERNVKFIIHSIIEITSQVKAQQRDETIKTIEKEHRLFMQAPIAIHVLKGPELIIEFANEPTLAIWGKGKEVMGRSIREVLPELTPQGYFELIENVRSTGKPFAAYEIPARMVRNGKEETVFFNLDYQPYYENGNTSPAGVLVFASEVTEKLAAKIALKESNERFEAALQVMQGYLWTNSSEGRMEGAQIGWTALTGQSYEQYKGYGWAKSVHPDDAQSTIDAWNKAVSERKIFIFEHRLKMRSGEWGVFSIRAIPLLNEDGSIREWVGVHTDITTQRKVEQNIRESEERFRKLADESPIFVFIIEPDPEAQVTYWNKTWLEYTGQSLEQAIVRTWDGIIHPDDVSIVMELYVPAFKKQQSYFIPAVRVKRYDGEFRWHSFKGNPRYLPDGTFNGYVGVGIDVHEQKLSEAIIKQSEAELQKRVAERTRELEEQKIFIGSILDASFNGIYALKAVRDAQGHVIDFIYLFVNNNIAKTISRRVDEVIGSSMLELIPENRNNGFFDLFCQLLETGKMHSSETHFVTAKIDSWYDYVIVPIDRETVVVTTEDITAKKLVALQMDEQRNLLDSILKNSSNGVSVSQVLRDEKGKVVDALTILANDAAVKFIGLPKDIYLSKKATEIEPDIIDSPYYQACIRTLETGEPFLMQYQMQTTGKWLELTVSKLDIDHLIHVFTDVTPIKEAQLQLERTVEELKRSNQNLEEFAYAASHDLKEPIRKILFFGDRLKGSLAERMTEEEGSSFERIETAAKRMGTLIDDLLSYSQVSLRPRHFEEVDLSQIVDLVVNDLDLEIDQRGAEVKVEKLCVVSGHHRQLQQAFQNLISNSIKYSKADVSPQISIYCQKVSGTELPTHLAIEDKQKAFWRVCIEDNGIGFEQEDAERIFNVFTRLHGNVEYRGTGLGLSIVRKVIENHNGYITAQSELGKGSVFELYLPA